MMPLNTASDQGLHCLFTECSIEICIKRKNTTQELVQLISWKICRLKLCVLKCVKVRRLYVF